MLNYLYAFLFHRGTFSTLTKRRCATRRQRGTVLPKCYPFFQELEDRTAWALRLQDEASALAQQLALIRASRWVKLGRKLKVGPEIA